ncbi:hypothetical protein [Cloacibacterium sp.]|uniref:hypothetical protein n=1 Tax=Cloacibacterium sp. TaxID=1913682 RepID=UPI0039E3F475
MKTIILIIFLFFGSRVNAQQEDNVFQKSENQTTGVSSKGDVNDNRVESNTGPSNPGDIDVVPIDNYILVLIIAGISLVIYQYKKRQKTIQ